MNELVCNYRLCFYMCTKIIQLKNDDFKTNNKINKNHIM